MSEYRGYEGRSLDFLKSNNVIVGDSVKVFSELMYSGIIMPRYEHSDDQHIVIKLKSGYNVGLELNKIKKIEKINSPAKSVENLEKIEKNEKVCICC